MIFDELRKQGLPQAEVRAFLRKMKALNEYELSTRDAMREAERVLGPANMDVFAAFLKLLAPEAADEEAPPLRWRAGGARGE